MTVKEFRGKLPKKLVHNNCYFDIRFINRDIRGAKLVERNNSYEVQVRLFEIFFVPVIINKNITEHEYLYLNLLISEANEDGRII